METTESILFHEEFNWDSREKQHPRVKPWHDFVSAAIYFYSAVTLMTFMMNFVHFRMPRPDKNEPLPDILHDLVPETHIGAPVEILFYANAVLILSACFFYFRWNTWAYAVRFFVSWGTTMHLRTLFMICTILPPTTDYYCRYAYPTPADFPHPIPNIYWNTISGVLSFGNTNVHCGDLIPSGHTTLIMHVWLFIFTYFKHNLWLTVSCSLLSFSKLFLIITERQHYTIDVVISVYICITVWRMTPEYLPWFLHWSRRCLCRHGKIQTSASSVALV
jgi:hypothetical protein